MEKPRPSESSKLLFRIARSVSDREAVDWDTELGRAPELLGTIGWLKSLQTLASVHERRAPAPSAGGATPSPGLGPTKSPISPTRWGPLQILESLGRGGFGHVYRAYDPLLEREVALKLWRRGREASRLLHEARALARLRHSNLPSVHGVDEHEGWLGMWTDLVRGRTLEELLATHGPLGAREAALVGVEICRALSVVHRAGLLHRDVKTTNVMREEGGRIVLLDFGLAVRADAPPEERAAGTPHSMAPELLRGGPATPASDVYALGVLLYRLVTRSLPFEAHTSAEVAGKQTRGERVELSDRRPDLPSIFVSAVDQALSYAPGSRHPSADAFEHALREFLEAPGIGGAAGDAPESARALPRFLTGFVGRGDELAECVAAVRANRLLTLIGPGGCGKTRLAIRAADVIAEGSSIPIAFADLSSLAQAATLEPEVRRALEAIPGPSASASTTIAQAIGSRPLVLVLDNCDPILAAVDALVAGLLAACPNLRVLATSRSPLRVPGEQVFEVPPLALPPANPDAGAASVSGFDAVRLFVERARRVRPDFRLTDQNAAAVVEVCRRADGLPLVIELAAARARAMTPEEIATRLSAGARLLERGDFSTAARHESLETAIRWTYDGLLSEQRLLMDGLAVFAGTWTLEAVARVCLEDASELGALDSTTDLIEKSLVATAPPCHGVSRYRLLDTLRGFALDRARESGRLPELQRRHFDYFLALAEDAESRLWGPEQSLWSARLDAEHANLLAALGWVAERPERAADRLRLASALARFWTERGHLSIGREALAAAIDAQDSGAATLAVARAMAGAGALAIYQSDPEQARSWCTRALEIFRQLDDSTGVARTLVTLGVVAHEVSDYPAAEQCYRESLELHRQLGDTRGIANVLNNLGAITWRQGRWEEASRLHQEAIAQAEPARDPGLRALALTNLGFVALHLERTTEAAGCLAEALGLVRGHQLLRHAAPVLEAAAAVLANRRESARAARLYAAAAEQRRELRSPIEPAWRTAHEPMRATIARDLGAERMQRESLVGRDLGLDGALEEAWRGLELVV